VKIKKNIILPRVWFVTLSEEHGLGMFDNRVLRRTSGPKRVEVVGSWRKLHNELRNLYSSPNIIRMITSRKVRCAWNVAPIGRRRKHTGFL
jgi:hypothetical protein